MDISDETTAEYFGWDSAKAKRHRQKLHNTGWFRSESFSYSGGRKGTTYYIGKEAVDASHAGNNVPFQLPKNSVSSNAPKPADP